MSLAPASITVNLLLKLMKVTVLAECSCFFCLFFLESLHSTAVCGHKSDRRHFFLPFLTIFCLFTFPGFPFRLMNGQEDCFTYSNEALKSLPIFLLKCFLDISQINLRPGHDDPNQCLVLCAHSSHAVVQPFSEESNFALHTFHCGNVNISELKQERLAFKLT